MYIYIWTHVVVCFVQVHAPICVCVLMYWLAVYVFMKSGFIAGCQADLRVAVTHVRDVIQDLDRAGFLHHIEWLRVVWGRAGGEPAHSAALWSWFLGGFQILQGVHEGEGGSPSDLNREGRKQHNGHSLMYLQITQGIVLTMMWCGGNTFLNG